MTKPPPESDFTHADSVVLHPDPSLISFLF